MAMSTMPIVLAGRAALEHATPAGFQAQWRALYDSCPWATACQHPDFVLPWYALYGARYLAVLVVETRGDGSLAGLLPLALEGSRRLCGAGDQQAEYQGWLQAPGADPGFIVRAVRVLRARYVHADLGLKYLPAGIALDGVDATGELGGNCVWRRHRRPLMRTEAGAMDRQRSKKNHRQNVNRLNRSGQVRFERITDHAQFVQVLGAICRQYDFRQAALYRAMPFANDAAKRLFCLALHRRGLLHVTILTVGGDLAAAHLGLLSAGRAVHLGVNTHDPARAAHSPGNLLLAMLGVHLAEEGTPWLDLTPGGDGYKESFASEHDTVLELVLYANAARRWRAQLLRGIAAFARARLRQAGVDATGLRAWRMQLRERPWSPVRRWLNRLRPASRPGLLRYAGTRPPGADGMLVSKNRLEDILRFDAGASPARYSAFLDTVMKRMERAQHLYTFIQDGTLALSCWARTQAASEAPSAGAAAGEGVVLSDLYVHRRYQGSALVEGFVRQLLHELAIQPPGEILYRGVASASSRAALARCGFVDAAASGSQAAHGLACR